MRILLFYIALVLAIFNAEGQTKEAVTLNVKDIKLSAKTDSIYQINCLLRNNKDSIINIPFNPMINGYNEYGGTQLGAIIFYIDKKNNKEDKIKLDVSAPIAAIYSEPLKPNNTRILKSYLTGYIFDRKGLYKVKLYMKYSVSDTMNENEIASNWFYIRVK